MYHQKIYLKVALLLFILGIFHNIGFSQNYHFIYLQSVNRQPFSVHINQQDFISTNGGYLIIPKLMPGKQQIQLQWQDNPALILNFVVPITDQDAGYTINKSETGNWQLNGLSNEGIIAATMPITEAATVNVHDEKSTNVQPSKSEIVTTQNDSIATQKNQQNEKAVLQADSENSNVKSLVVKKEVHPSKGVSGNKNNNVSKTFEKMGPQGLDQIYVDKSQAKADTIAVFIPLKQAPRATVQQNSNVGSDKNADTQTQNVLTNTPSADTLTQNKNTKIFVPSAMPACLAASKDDFNATRIAMATSKTDAAMIDAAKKAFEKKCYTVEQIKNLGVLFLSQQNRLAFFAAAKNHLVDTENFPSLINQFLDPNIIEQFKLLEKNN